MKRILLSILLLCSIASYGQTGEFYYKPTGQSLRFTHINTKHLPPDSVFILGNVKTINSTSLFGSGNISLQVPLVNQVNIKSVGGVTLLGSGDLTITPTIADGSITYAKLQNISAASRLIGRGSAAGAGVPQEISLGSTLTLNNLVLDVSGSVGTGTVTSVGLSAGTTGLTISGSPITTSGTLTLSGGTLVAANGGTGLGSYTIGDVVTATGSTTLSAIADVAAGSYFRSGGVATAPLWSTLTLPNAATANQMAFASATNALGFTSGVTYNGTTHAITGTGSATVGFTTTIAGGTAGGYTASRSGTLAGSGTILGLFTTGVVTLRGTSSDAVYYNRSNSAITTGATNQTINGFTVDPSLTINHTGVTIYGGDYNPTLGGSQTPTHYAQVWRSGLVGVGTATPTSTLTVNGSFGKAYVAKTALYTLTISDYLVEVTSGTHTQTLPTAVGIAGREYVITNSGTGVVTVGTTSSQTFVNVSGMPTTLTLNQFQTVIVFSNGANWLRTSTL